MQASTTEFTERYYGTFKQKIVGNGSDLESSLKDFNKKISMFFNKEIKKPGVKEERYMKNKGRGIYT